MTAPMHNPRRPSLAGLGLLLAACASLPAAPPGSQREDHKTTSAGEGQNVPTPKDQQRHEDVKATSDDGVRDPPEDDTTIAPSEPLDASWQKLLDGDLDPLLHALDGADEATLIRLHAAAEDGA